MTPPEGAADWFRIDNAAEESDETDIYVYDSIGGWFGMYSDEFIDALKGVTTSKINLRLNSPGGSVFEGIAIANAIRNHPANVTVYVDSLAASIASVIALAGDRVVMMPQSQFMVHNASGGCYGDASEMTKMADLLDKQSLNIAKAYAEHTGRPLAEWRDYMAEETWFTAEEAVAAGLADEVIPMRPKKNEDAEEPAAVAALMNRTWDLSTYQNAGREVAPAPVIKDATPFATGGVLVTNEAVTTVPGEVIVRADVLSNLSAEDLAAMIRDAVCAEIEDAKKKLPAFLQPDEDEDENGDEEEPDEDTDNASDATADDGIEPSANSVDTDTGTADDIAEHAGVRDENDDWLSLVDRLTDSPSPSADDAFQSLKEAWL
jgi:ATP-dependent Clp endopeptidase proteolytic subunit ClpP